MQNVDLQGLGRLADGLDGLIKTMPERKRALFEEMGRAVLSDVRGRIGGRGKVQRWQDRFVGSKLGYVAVRPVADAYDEKGYAAGYVTNAVENGHRQSRRYVPALGKQLKAERVMGKGFYQGARAGAEQTARRAAENFARAVVRELEG